MSTTHLFNNDRYVETWNGLSSSLEHANTIHTLIEARGRAEGYALGLFDAGVISPAQRQELLTMVNVSAAQRAKVLRA